MRCGSALLASRPLAFSLRKESGELVLRDLENEADILADKLIIGRHLVPQRAERELRHGDLPQVKPPPKVVSSCRAKNEIRD